MSTKHRVMVVDDDPAFLLITRTVLESANYEVETARNATEALFKMTRRKPDLVFLDVVMDHVLDGVNLCEEVARNDGLRGLPIILVTSIRDSEYRAAFPQDVYLPVDGWIFKPYDPDELIKKANRILRSDEA